MKFFLRQILLLEFPIIFMLEKEGVSLNEIILNLEEQGFGLYFESFMERTKELSARMFAYEIALKTLRRRY